MTEEYNYYAIRYLENSRQYFNGVHIPIGVSSYKDIDWTEKIILCIINDVTVKGKCWLSNTTISKFINKDVSSISKNISKLMKKGLVCGEILECWSDCSFQIRLLSLSEQALSLFSNDDRLYSFNVYREVMSKEFVVKTFLEKIIFLYLSQHGSVPIKNMSQILNINERTIKQYVTKMAKNNILKADIFNVNKENVEMVYNEIKDKVLFNDKPFECSWCHCKCGVLEKHHFPIPSRFGGTEIVKICPTCHSSFHSIEKSVTNIIVVKGDKK